MYVVVVKPQMKLLSNMFVQVVTLSFTLEMSPGQWTCRVKATTNGIADHIEFYLHGSYLILVVTRIVWPILMYFY